MTTTQLSNTSAVLVSETTAQNYYTGGPFTLGTGPRTDLVFNATDDETDFASFGAQYGESFGAGRQQGELTAPDGTDYDNGLISLEDVIYLSHPTTGEEIRVGRVSMREAAEGGPGAQTQDFYIFSAPIDAGVTYSITRIDYTPGSNAETSHTYSTFSGGDVVCFLSGTLIQTGDGVRPVQDLRAGDHVQTVDNGVQRIVWVGCRDLSPALLKARPALRPIYIPPGRLGADTPLFVSPQHRVLVGDHLVKARHLLELGGFGARVAWGKRQVRYHHLLLEDHQILLANGSAAESLFLGPIARTTLERGAMCAPQDARRSLTLRHKGMCRNALSRRADLLQLDPTDWCRAA